MESEPKEAEKWDLKLKVKNKLQRTANVTKMLQVYAGSVKDLISQNKTQATQITARLIGLHRKLNLTRQRHDRG